jgi:hypothetical protein
MGVQKKHTKLATGSGGASLRQPRLKLFFYTSVIPVRWYGQLKDHTHNGGISHYINFSGRMPVLTLQINCAMQLYDA